MLKDLYYAVAAVFRGLYLPLHLGYIFYYFLHSAVTGGRASGPYGAAAPSIHIGLQNHEAHHMPGVWEGSVNSPQVSSTKEF